MLGIIRKGRVEIFKDLAAILLCLYSGHYVNENWSFDDAGNCNLLEQKQSLMSIVSRVGGGVNIVYVFEMNKVRNPARSDLRKG